MDTSRLASLLLRGDAALAVLGLGLVLIMIAPLPVFALDMLLALSFSLSLLVFMVALQAKKPVDVSVFPTVLLGATLLRLGLNVASTRLILLGGAEGGASAAGRIIETFGQVVVGGDYFVGAIAFIILVVINFVVITKGAGRIAEVSARFTLDAMPGKQMAIDAELNAGFIDEVEARSRRDELSRETEFYGAMDGASKFIRGDAMAGLAITAINFVGGALLGVVAHGLSVGEALSTYGVLTIGDGLAGQMPALVLSTAAGILVTRVKDVNDAPLHQQMENQLLGDGRVPMLVGGSLLLLGLVPGLAFPFIPIGGAVAGLGWVRAGRPETPEAVAADEPKPEASTGVDALLLVEPLSLEIAVDLLPLVEATGGDLIARIQRVREEFAKDRGIILPSMHIRDNLDLDHGTYVLRLRGEEIGRGKVMPRQHLALDPGTGQGELEGLPTTDPAFGLDAWWIPDREVLNAQRQGFTVVDVPTVLTTHLVELLSVHAHELFGGDQLDALLDRVAGSERNLVDELAPDKVPRATLLRILRQLVAEGLSIRDANTIFEAVVEHLGRTRDPAVLTELVRQRMARHITGRYADPEGRIHYVGLAPKTESAVLGGLKSQEGRAPALLVPPDVARRLIVEAKLKTAAYDGPGQAVLICPPLARGAVRRLLERVAPRIPVLSSAEVLSTAKLVPIAMIEAV